MAELRENTFSIRIYKPDSRDLEQNTCTVEVLFQDANSDRPHKTGLFEIKQDNRNKLVSVTHTHIKDGEKELRMNKEDVTRAEKLITEFHTVIASTVSALNTATAPRGHIHYTLPQDYSGHRTPKNTAQGTIRKANGNTASSLDVSADYKETYYAGRGGDVAECKLAFVSPSLSVTIKCPKGNTSHLRPQGEVALRTVLAVHAGHLTQYKEGDFLLTGLDTKAPATYYNTNALDEERLGHKAMSSDDVRTVNALLTSPTAVAAINTALDNMIHKRIPVGQLQPPSTKRHLHSSTAGASTPNGRG